MAHQCVGCGANTSVECLCEAFKPPAPPPNFPGLWFEAYFQRLEQQMRDIKMYTLSVRAHVIRIEEKVDALIEEQKKITKKTVPTDAFGEPLLRSPDGAVYR